MAPVTSIISIEEEARTSTALPEGKPVRLDEFLEKLPEEKRWARRGKWTLTINLEKLVVPPEVFSQLIDKSGALSLEIKGEESVLRVLSLKRPIKVAIQWQEDGRYYMAQDRRSLVYGVGDTVESALKDYMAQWVDRYLWLQDNREELGPAPMAELRSFVRMLAEEKPFTVLVKSKDK